MKPNPRRLPARATTKRVPAFLPLLLAALPLAAQQGPDKPAPVPDPIKGWHDMAPMSAEEIAARHQPYQPRGEAAASVAPRSDWQPPRAVLFDRQNDGPLWASTPSYKASFGAEGFVYVPFLGSQAPQNHPLHFVVRAVRVGGRALPLAQVEPSRDGQRVTFARGAVHEVYDLGVENVEQTFVVDTPLSGDVDVEIEVQTDLVEDAATPGIQFGNELGVVSYGQAHVVDGGGIVPVPTTCENKTIRIHVPASLRGAGPLVIDPIIHTSAFVFAGGQDSTQPDIAYDASFDQYLVVWQYNFSALDLDVYSEFRNGDGTVVPNSLGVIDSSTISCGNPRVGNLAAYDRFLVVMQRFENGGWDIYGRLRLAGQTPHPIFFQIDNPGGAGQCVNPDIGGDGGNGDRWLVVWQRELSATDWDIHARCVHGDTSMPAQTIFLENSGASIHSMPSVSQSNGNGFATAARWLVVYQFRFSATDEDIYGCAVSQTGTITTLNTVIDSSGLSDQVPSVSSPNTMSAGGNPLYLVTYERQNPFEARARLLSGALVGQIGAVNLSVAFGLGGFWVRAECDGYRFAVLNGAGTIGVATLAYDGSALVLHESTQNLPGVPSYPRICSKRSGGGSMTDFGIAYVEESTVPDRIGVSAYRGHNPNASVVRRVMGCSGLGIGVGGRPFLGEGLTFSLSGVGFDIPAFAFGVPAPASNLFCTQCPLGVSLSGVVLLVGPTLSIPIPASTAFLGAGASVQGVGLGSGPCALQLRFSDTFDFTIG